MPRVLLIDDEESARAALRTGLSTRAGLSIVAEADSVASARTPLRQGGYDIVLLAVPMRTGDAFELLTDVSAGARVICLTESDDPCVGVLEQAAMEYWLKPANPERIARLADRMNTPAQASPAMIPVKQGMTTRLLLLDDIRIVAARENYTEVVLSRSERLFVRRTMQQWAERLPARQFARVHRGVFLNLNRVGRIERDEKQATWLHFSGGELDPIEVKRRHWAAVRAKLDAWRKSLRTPPQSAYSGPTLGVLPFANIGGEPENEGFCDGLTEELLNVLGKVRGLRVAARTSLYAFKSRHEPVAEIARQLGVDYIVEGSVRRLGRQFRVNAQLLQAADGFPLWADTFYRDGENLFALQDEIAALVCQPLLAKLPGLSRTQRPVEPQVHALMQAGRHYRALQTSAGLDRAQAAFAEAVALAPDYAPAHAGLADVFSMRAFFGAAEGRLDAGFDCVRAHAAAHTAIDLDPTLAGPHVTLGRLAFQQGQLELAERELTRSLALDPRDPFALKYNALIKSAQGRLSEAIAHAARGVDAQPFSAGNLASYASLLALARRWEEALEMNERASHLRAEICPANVAQRAQILLALGHERQAVATARRVRTIRQETLYPRHPAADVLFVFRRANLKTEATATLLQARAKLSPTSYLHGVILSAAGRYDEAYEALRLSPPLLLPELYWSQVWDDARSTAQFRALIMELGRANEYELARTESAA